MSISFNWKKILLVTVNIVMAVYVILAVTAFNKPTDEIRSLVCSQVSIDIDDSTLNGFLDAEEIKYLLQTNRLYPLGQPMAEVNTRLIEEILMDNPFIEQAECYKAQQGTVCITLLQSIPMMRIKSDNGDDYYVDTKGRILPPAKYISNLIVVTGNVSKTFAVNVLTPMVNTINTDKFWQKQTVQINVLEDNTIELVPRVGDNIIYLGEAVDVEKKLKRMELFYQYGLSHAGWNKYSRISVEFDNQIVCKKRMSKNVKI